MKNKIRVFDYTYDIAYQSHFINALQDYCLFNHGLNTRTHWNECERAFPARLSFVSHYEPGQYDVAILHIDQEVVVPGHIKLRVYEEFNKLITDIPKIVINHGAPVCPELYRKMGRFYLSETQMEQHCKQFVKQLVGENTMVVNSYTAATESEWGFGIPIVPGMDHEEFCDLPKEPRVFTAIATRGFDSYYNRRCIIETDNILDKRYGYLLAFANDNVDTGKTPADYKTYLGKSLLYLDTSYRTPMNLARTEAFLSGCCVIQVKGAHDLQRWARDGENIVLVPNNPSEIARIIAGFIENNYQDAIRIGKNGRAMALKEFDKKQFQAKWLALFNALI